MYDITIKPVLNGWTAKVGCQTLVYVDKRAMLDDLDRYLTDPEATEKAFVSSAVNKRLLDGPCVELCAPPQGHGMPETACAPTLR